jgi:diadenosine tetraphosphate (Ap4A) HIT family hydrolase
MAKHEANETLLKFGYPETVVGEYKHWVVLARPKQITLGSLILACRDDATAFSEIPRDAFDGLQQAVTDIETILRQEVDYAKINYLMLMMVDPNVHFHVIPRYEGTRSLNGIDYPDGAWPGPPDVKVTKDIAKEEMSALISHFRGSWARLLAARATL